jgi:competence protein ComEC
MLYTLKGEEWHPGQYISFLYHGSVPENNPLPGGFDYSTWLKQKSIHRVQFTQKYEIICTLNTINYPRRLIFRIQKGIQEVYKTYLKNKVTRGLIEALIFGIKDELEESTTKIYADTGTIHVLAVSGLHVGLLFMGMQLITKPIRKKWPKFAIQMAGLWLYVFICGAEPSILRAGIMLSVVAWGKSIKKNTSVFNNLGLAGILILLFQPNELFNAGFLLSFLAVGGIAWLHPILCRILAFKNTYLQKIYEFSMVTLAAQIITLPVTIHLFHRFPTYFLISNLLIIPLTTLITFGGIILLLISPVTVASELLGDLIEKTIGLCNAIAQHMSQWPGAIINDIYITIPELIFLSATVIYCILAFGDLCKHYLKIAVVMATLFYMSHTARICIQEIQSENISLTYHKTTIQLFIRGRHAKAYIQFYKKRTPKTIHNIYSFLKERGIREIILTEKTNFPDKFQP